MARPVGLLDAPTHETKERLLAAGLALFLEKGYAATGIQDLLDATGIPRGSFYHHFDTKEDFALEVIDAYTSQVHVVLEATLADRRRAPLNRIRTFFERVRESYASEGYLGCLLGTLGQELAATSRVFQLKIEGCMSEIALCIGDCLEEAQQRGELSSDVAPRQLANVIVNCWEGAALRSRLVRDPAPLDAVLNFCLNAVRAPRS